MGALRAQAAIRFPLMRGRLQELVREFGCRLGAASVRWESITERKISARLWVKVLVLGRSAIGTTVCRSKWSWSPSPITLMTVMLSRSSGSMMGGGRLWVIWLGRSRRIGSHSCYVWRGLARRHSALG